MGTGLCHVGRVTPRRPRGQGGGGGTPASCPAPPATKIATLPQASEPFILAAGTCHYPGAWELIGVQKDAIEPLKPKRCPCASPWLPGHAGTSPALAGRWRGHVPREPQSTGALPTPGKGTESEATGGVCVPGTRLYGAFQAGREARGVQSQHGELRCSPAKAMSPSPGSCCPLQ